jgi:hypothetical protein
MGEKKTAPGLGVERKCYCPLMLGGTLKMMQMLNLSPLLFKAHCPHNGCGDLVPLDYGKPGRVMATGFSV